MSDWLTLEKKKKFGYEFKYGCPKSVSLNDNVGLDKK